ncbi:MULTISPECIES: PQQ-like beta-propeller repeat protein [unclassified Sphingomonas]|uniref:PQQ-like beta-propeller repeat protein n=2 Tax=Sphingomonas TaxID=13687 RepID=UPI000BC5FEDA|nr:MAG: pyrrolo-quinoline quinone [Sphingomonas sp. 12-62-6]OYX40198.1 MAG: pyrrolo-quinoline quinone [Sphingomonas sp. 32-62-10]
MKKSLKTSIAIALVVALSGCGAFKGGQKKTPTLGSRVPILVAENGAEVDKSIADVQVLLPPPAANVDWAQPGGNAAKSMGHVALGTGMTRLWSASIDGGSVRQRLGAAPVVADNKLFAVDVDAVAHAFAADTGKLLWSAKLIENKDNRAARFGGGISYDDGKVFATTGLGDIVALNAADGAVLWRAHPAGPLRGAPTVANGALYIVSQNNELVALSQADGSIQWTGSGSLESQGVFGVGAPAAGRGTIVAGFSSGELYAYRYENGRVLWTEVLSRTSVSTSVSSLTDIDAAPVIDQNRVYAVGEGGRMVSLELTTGQRVWEQNLAGVSTPWIAGEWLFVVTEDAKLYCLSRANGKIRWISDLGGFKNVKKRKNPIHWSGPVLAGDQLILLNSEGQIVPVSPATGQKGEIIKGSSAFSLPPLVANNILYTIDSKGRISAYR